MHGRRRRAETEFAISFTKDLRKLWGHVEGRLARSSQGFPCVTSCPLWLKLTEHRGAQEAPVLSPVYLCAPCGKDLGSRPPRNYFCCFFFFFMYSSTSATVLRWSSALESTVSRASVSRNSYCLASSALVLPEFFRARSLA